MDPTEGKQPDDDLVGLVVRHQALLERVTELEIDLGRSREANSVLLEEKLGLEKEVRELKEEVNRYKEQAKTQNTWIAQLQDRIMQLVQVAAIIEKGDSAKRSEWPGLVKELSDAMDDVRVFINSDSVTRLREKLGL